MNIIIPLGGKGERFKNEYRLPKPLIKIFDKEMIFYEDTYDLTGGNNSKFIEIVGIDDPAYFMLSRPYRFVNLSNLFNLI